MTNHRELLSYFSLTELPFTKEIPVEQLHLLPSVERNLAAVQLLVDTRGIGAITGKPGTGKSCLLRLVAGQRRIPQPANQHFRSAPSDDAGVVGKSGAGGHRVGVLLDESASCRYGCLRLPCAPGGPPSYHFAWWDAPQEATWRSRTPGGRYGRLIPRFGPLRCTPCGP